MDHDGDGVEIVRAERRRDSPSACAPSERLLDEDAAPAVIALALGRGQAQVDRHRDGAEQQAGVQRLGEGQARRQRDRDALPGHDAALRQARPRRRAQRRSSSA